jgi:NADP-dependent 3-hydroxy acid dehydrogenase YdfG
MSTMLVTGVTGGLGRAIADKFISQGWTVIGLARNDRDLIQMKSQLGSSFFPFSVDVSRADEVSKSFELISSKFPKLDVLINNAAIFKLASFDKCSVDDIDKIIDTNLKGPMYCAYFAMKVLNFSSGRMINISSVAGTHGIKHQSIYCASKFGLEGFGESLGQELQAQGISITTISPGGIDTPLWSEISNPYPGEDKNNLLKPRDIVRIIERITDLPSNVVLKSVIVFPSNEWH